MSNLDTAMKDFKEAADKEYRELYYQSLHEIEMAFECLSEAETKRRLYDAHEKLFQGFDKFLADFGDGVLGR